MKGKILKNAFTYITTILLGGLLLDLVIWVITPSVIIVKDNNEWEKHHYLFSYVDKSDERHLLVLFGNYLDNQSSQILEKKIYTYGNLKSDLNKYSIEYQIGFHKLRGDFDVVLSNPPAYVRGRRTQSVLDYKKPSMFDALEKSRKKQ